MSPSSRPRPRHPWWPLVAICLGTFMLLVDVTIVNVALPSIATALGSSFAELQWVVDGYALALAALLMLAGSLADRFGRRRLYLVGLLVFSTASLACGLAPDPTLLIVARVVQGAGGAAMFATTAALIATVYEGRQRGVAFGVWGAVNGLAAASGPVLGGVLTETLGWPAIFLVNLPVALAAVVLTVAVVAESTGPVTARLDVGGAMTFTLAAAALVYGLINAGEHGWAGARTVVGLVVAAAALAAFVAVEHRSPAPMLDLRLFRRGPFTALMIASAVLSAAAFPHLAFVSIWLQSALGLDAIDAGLVTVPLSLASFVVALLAGRLLTHRAPVWPVAGGLAVIGTGALLLATLGDGSTGWALLPGLVVVGIGVGAATPVLASATLAAVPTSQAGMGSAAVNAFRQLGVAIGLALLGTVFSARLTTSVAAAGAPDAAALGASLAGGRAGAVLAEGRVPAAVVREAFTSALDGVFVVAGGAALVAAVLVAFLLTRRPAPGQPAAGSSNSARRSAGTRSR